MQSECQESARALSLSPDGLPWKLHVCGSLCWIPTHASNCIPLLWKLDQHWHMLSEDFLQGKHVAASVFNEYTRSHDGSYWQTSAGCWLVGGFVTSPGSDLAQIFRWSIAAAGRGHGPDVELRKQLHRLCLMLPGELCSRRRSCLISAHQGPFSQPSHARCIERGTCWWWWCRCTSSQAALSHRISQRKWCNISMITELIRSERSTAVNESVVTSGRVFH